MTINNNRYIDDQLSRLNDAADIQVDYLCRQKRDVIPYAEYEMELTKLFEETNRISTILENRHILVSQELERLQLTIDSRTQQINTIGEGQAFSKPSNPFNNIAPGTQTDLKTDMKNNTKTESEFKNSQIKYKFKCWMKKGKKKILLILKVNKMTYTTDCDAQKITNFDLKANETSDNHIMDKSPTLDKNALLTDSKSDNTNLKIENTENEQTEIFTKSLPNNTINSSNIKDRLSIQSGAESINSDQDIQTSLPSVSNYKVLTPLVQISSANNVLGFDDRSSIGTSSINTPLFFKGQPKRTTTERDSLISDSKLSLLESAKNQLKSKLQNANSSFERWKNSKSNYKLADTECIKTGNSTKLCHWNMNKRRKK
ncbi:hypothetical protein TPHA_0A03475 [Tetrapisispora phaffii CBS 4417]|uniref:Uncharacterized protein n=1 Tax=Tetrapisispora phaffii (strain ATCC 24235 / CBS 4417 / NBRC 1672 / NRRL Y-8282 / UCD 70-5) TaxID=1071381 RepID=G8BNE6_TETPH|nr:hypothetical protein TPHA_0A03475 [Tetrapisispora phaffii CBS 4417]CCE61424.1 hypothetical protein TPHA_0A03475 [Tetrapisispora phaffii CBS 4417]